VPGTKARGELKVGDGGKKGPAQVLPPHSYEAEQALLGSILCNNAVYYRCADFLKPEHFADALHGRIYATIGGLMARGVVADIITLKNQFDADGALADIGGGAYLVMLAQAVVTVLNAEDYARAIVDLFVRRMVIGSAEAMIAQAQVIDWEKPISGLITQFEGLLYEAAETAAAQDQLGPVPARKYLYEALEQLEAAHRQQSIVGGIGSGLAALDAVIGAFLPGKQYVLAGRPSMGKSALAIQVADGAARQGFKTILFTPEMGRSEIGIRQLSMEARISGFRAQRGKLSEAEFLCFIDAQRAIDQMPLWIDDASGITIADLAMRARRHKQKHGLDFIVIDYLQLVYPVRQTDNRASDVGSVSRGIKELAKSLEIPVLTLSQLSRRVEDRHDKRPQLSDLRESGSIEQDADVVLFMFREFYYHERAEPSDPAKRPDWERRGEEIENKAEIIVAKQRAGPLGTAHVLFDKSLTKFSDPPTEIEDGGLLS
jgi:replicative DNA helicase